MDQSPIITKAVHPKAVAVVPLEYAAMGAPPETPSWAAPLPQETRDQAELRARIAHMEAEKATFAAGLVQKMAAARAAGYESARKEDDAQRAGRVEEACDALIRAVTAFESAQDRYFAGVEEEVVRLALAIAARILHREAQMDPLLLTGVVKVALHQLSESTEVRMHVPAAEAELWKEMLQLAPNLSPRPAVVAEAEMRPGDCRLESTLGSVDLGVQAQLYEIERGFFDLLEQRGKLSHAAAS
jgi:flagellar assembly protein FliH